jgi:hypothetical protein
MFLKFEISLGSKLRIYLESHGAAFESPFASFRG